MENWETDWNRDVLERIVALLFALANLADRAAGVPYLRRRRVLGILSYGEVEARAFVIEVLTDEPAPSDVPQSIGEAACLAVRLRALAMALYVLLLAWRPTLSGASGPRAGWQGPVGPAGHQAALPAPDTS